MKKTILIALAGLTAFALVTGFAASLSIGAGDLGAGTEAVAACDNADVDTDIAGDVDITFVLSTNGKDVTAVDISDIAAACDGQDFYVELGDGSATPLASNSASDVSVAYGAGAEQGTTSLTIADTVDPEAVTSVSLTIAE